MMNQLPILNDYSTQNCLRFYVDPFVCEMKKENPFDRQISKNWNGPCTSTTTTKTSKILWFNFLFYVSNVAISRFCLYSIWWKSFKRVNTIICSSPVAFCTIKNKAKLSWSNEHGDDTWFEVTFKFNLFQLNQWFVIDIL